MALIWAAMSRYVIQSLTLDNNSVEKTINVQQGVFFFFFKKQT